MPARVRKAIGSVGILAFLLTYIVVASSLGGHMPDQPLIRFAFYLIAGVGWAIPLIPLMIWMNRGR